MGDAYLPVRLHLTMGKNTSPIGSPKRNSQMLSSTTVRNLRSNVFAVWDLR